MSLYHCLHTQGHLEKLSPLPLDVCEVIVKVLAGEAGSSDFATLRQLSLASKAFVPLCQKQLFQRVALVQKWDWARPRSRSLAQAHYPIDNLHLHVHVLAHPHLSAYIHSLEISCLQDYERSAGLVVLHQMDEVTEFTSGYTDGNREEVRTPHACQATCEGIKHHINGFVQRDPGITVLSLFGVQDLPMDLSSRFVAYEHCHS
jgi:hypothetical protein